MALSDHEQRVIQDLEEQLAAADPRLARTLSLHGMQRRSGRLTGTGLAMVALGIMAMVAALLVESVPLGVGAFLVMAAGLYTATLPAAVVGWRHGQAGLDSNARSLPDR
ncbi:DUF3040 domain-containing protein [Arthrobacter sp. 35W]|uniref:DUF3040 domain-containing protein n=1 Tax=Arthrobacter sp. 35W TaxID=1132441 RepID=UPI0006840058|nr:DUF3040 domain-containing protein [Arthrobacter sp. 35W]